MGPAAQGVVVTDDGAALDDEVVHRGATRDSLGTEMERAEARELVTGDESASGGTLALGQEPRLLTPYGSRLRAFPRWAAILLGAGVALSIPSSPTGGSVSQLVAGVAKTVAILGMCAIASWAEQRVYQGLLGAKRVGRVLLTFFVPLLVGVLTPFLAMLGALAVIVGDDGTAAFAILAGGGWMASAAAGTAIMVLIDVVISAVIPDFRSRVQAAVLSLLTLTAAFAVAVYWLARKLGATLHRVGTEMVPDDMVLGTPEGDVAAPQIRDFLTRPETADLIALGLGVLVVLGVLPAILSACGKLADGVMERLNPLSDALAEVSRGRLDVRVEEGGSRDFVQISQGFNRMAKSLTETLTDLDVRNRDLAEMNRATSRFVPYQFLELLDKRTIRDIERGDQIQLDISILFADIRGFTTMAEQMGPAATFGFINRYLGHMEAEIHREQGFINDIFGDGIMALFHQGADAAVQAALGMLAAVERFNATLVAEDQEPIRVGIGMNSGPLMLGTIGGEERLSCTVVGDPANTAARVEGMTKLYGAALLISQGTYERLADPARYTLREVDRVRAKGKDEPLAIYEVLDGDPPEVREQKLGTAEIFDGALVHYRAGAFDAALQGFEACRDQAPADASAALYVERCQEHVAHGPPADWDGVTRLRTK
ncbi:MAG: adenylate/guanylate cyclase domain-containing protein [Deltaproteobacteria bacterium]|nr:adenylate/guanylate cyclase domain-containing protein [Deltaproteobacteria bacterium]